MSNYYDVTFHELSGKSVVKREIISEKDTFDVWQDACESFTDEMLNIRINEDTFVSLNRRFVVRIDVEEVEGPVDKQIKRHDEIMGVVNTLSNMGF
ncbi:hypothetical protein JZO66_05500 [Enterococcus sp. DIV0242_7C1]|uniref:Uncharacterized protein n=1 Tax=Candidatus Enterococcus dunnyi TaxID=1834192 RepID=A0A200IZL2_9ENTE|nr:MULTISPECIES: hypothetical protein [unclassified Enterococcus]MBO0469989.1 hypothetical protein [Enterococcus sp. DIV0242_7C1]OUZ30432.1 hypothetical protein A5889_002720 [Enterococcus sp. 9D6_DIV0238]